LFFALIFDTSSQVAAWALIGEGNTQNLFTNSILIGLSFTSGMMITDTLNGLFFYQILHRDNAKLNFRIFLSLLIIISSLIIGSIQLLEKVGFTINIADEFKLTWGIFIMAATIIGVIFNLYYSKKQPRKL
jgi:high-affinity nickel permease